MSQTTLFVCSLCRFSPTEKTRQGVSGGEHLIAQLRAQLEARNLSSAVQLEPLRCMAGCSQPCNVSLAAPGKLTYILSGVAAAEDAATVAEFCAQYGDSPDGRVPYRDRAAAIRKATAFVLPPLPVNA